MTQPTCEDLVAQSLGHGSRAVAPLEIQLAADYYCRLGFHPETVALQFHVDGKLSQLIRKLRALGFELTSAQIDYWREQFVRGARVSDAVEEISDPPPESEAQSEVERPRTEG